MAVQMQVMPPGDGNHGTIAVNGRTYNCALGSIITVPFEVGQRMLANGWLPTCSNGSGTTADRPPANTMLVQPGKPGIDFHDTTVGALIRWDGYVWRNLLTGAAV